MLTTYLSVGFLQALVSNIAQGAKQRDNRRLLLLLLARCCLLRVRDRRKGPGQRFGSV